MNGAMFDPKTAFGGGVSLAAADADEGTHDGAWVDMDGTQGPVNALCAVGAATGSPSAQSVTFTLREADDDQGDGDQAIPVQGDAVVFDDDSLSAWLQGQRTKRYVSVRAVVDFTTGSSPDIPVFAVVQGQKYEAA